MHVDFYTPFPVDECLHRLRMTTDQRPLPLFPSWTHRAKPVIAKLAPPNVVLEKRRVYRNPFPPILQLHLVSCGERTHVTGSTGTAVPLRVLFGIWIGGSVILTMSSMFAAVFGLPLSSASVSHPSWFVSCIPALFGIFGFAIVAVGKALGEPEEQFLVSFVTVTLDGEPSSRDRAST